MIARRGGLVVLPLVLALVAATRPVPWPFGVAPTADAVQAQVAEALRIGRRERFEEVNGAFDPIEASAAIDLAQATLDAGQISPDDLFIRGDEFFAHFFTMTEGFGGLLQGPRLQRVHQGATGGLDTQDCEGCHAVGGLDGAGSFPENALLLGDGDTAASAVPRNPPALLGAGLVQALGVEMSAELAAQREAGLSKARASGQDVQVDLHSKGVAFGALTAHPDGSVDTSKVEGVSADLVVRPFGWKGDVARLRRFVEEAARLHFGAQTVPLEARNVASPDPVRVGQPTWDPDGDGRSREIEEGALSVTALYLAMLETPMIVPPNDPGLLQRWASGSRLFDQVGCAACHVRSLTLNTRIWQEVPDSPGGKATSFNLLQQGEQPRGDDRVTLFSDLRRHDLGPGLADAQDHPDGVARAQFLTRPLWGLAESAPYLHTGQAVTIPDAILAHGGEAQGARDAFAALPPDRQADLHIFLLSLTRAPKVRIAR